ncbi:MAG: MBL fold metallo-hydrolase [Pseudomonadota bacterium]
MNDDTPHIVLLGTKGGPAIRQGSTMPTASLVVMGGEQIVVDCGLGVTRALTDQSMALKDLRTVFITHLHSDHYLELGPLLHTAWTAGLSAHVTVWGPDALARYWQNFCASMIDDIDLRIVDEGRPDLRDLVRVREIATDVTMEVGPVKVNALRVDHPPIKDCFALRFAAEGKRVVFSSDTSVFPPLAQFAKGADLLVHEAMLEEALEALVARVGNTDGRLMQHLRRSHSTATEAAKIAKEAGVGALALHHLIPSDDPEFTPAHWEAAVRKEWDGLFHLGRDGLRIDL